VEVVEVVEVERLPLPGERLTLEEERLLPEYVLGWRWPLTLAGLQFPFCRTCVPSFASTLFLEREVKQPTMNSQGGFNR
jgi:hypothetical protein